jgi:hypothetical protein
MLGRLETFCRGADVHIVRPYIKEDLPRKNQGTASEQQEAKKYSQRK